MLVQAPSEMIHRGGDLCLEHAPSWDDKGAVDMYYWYFATMFLNQVGGAYDKAWLARLRECYITGQNEDGSWDADGAWGSAGGTVYSTSMAALALLTPYRYPHGLLEVRHQTGYVKAALKKLNKVAKKSTAEGKLATSILIRLRREVFVSGSR